jgi:uncharacterized repeat protein (TIGR03803 family)
MGVQGGKVMKRAVKVVWLCLVVCSALRPAPAQAQVVILHSFAGGNTDGANPQGSLLQVGSNFYGVAVDGGSAADAGVIFKIGVNGSAYAVTHTFTNGPDGGGPSGSLTQGVSGLYGLTSLAGSLGQGTMFTIGVDGTGFGVVHSFAGTPSDGGNPSGSLAQSASTFFGYTTAGGSAGKGAVFKTNADGTGYVVLHSFTGGAADGNDPIGGAPAISGTTLYGMTALGGASNVGVVYKIGTDGSGFTVLRSFTASVADGISPFGSVIVSGNTLYGLTHNGGSSLNGTIFKMNTDGTGFTLMHSFAGGPADGRDPLGELLLSGSNLYGTTYQGGTADVGTLFSIGIDGSGYNVMHSFLGGPTDGSGPYNDLTLIGSTFYGTTTLGGVSNDGTIFSFTPVPEPGTMALVSAAAAGAAWVIRRKRLNRTRIASSDLGVGRNA